MWPDYPSNPSVDPLAAILHTLPGGCGSGRKREWTEGVAQGVQSGERVQKPGGKRFEMFRLEQTVSSKETVITIEGQLVSDYVAAMESCCDQVLSSGKSVVIFLRDVPLVDSDGCALLRRLLARGARIRASGVYTQYLVEQLKDNRL